MYATRAVPILDADRRGRAEGRGRPHEREIIHMYGAVAMQHGLERAEREVGAVEAHVGPLHREARVCRVRVDAALREDQVAPERCDERVRRARTRYELVRVGGARAAKRQEAIGRDADVTSVQAVKCEGEWQRHGYCAIVALQVKERPVSVLCVIYARAHGEGHVRHQSGQVREIVADPYSSQAQSHAFCALTDAAYYVFA